MNVAVKPDIKPDERAPGPTFDTDRILYVDFETRGTLPIAVGTDCYARHAEAIMLAWAFGEGPVHVECVETSGSWPLEWKRLTYEFRKFFGSVERGEAVLCAHNASFDRAVWQHSTIGFPDTTPDMWIDTRAQATASGLPAALEWAAKYTGTDVLKDKAGKKLIKLFTLPTSEARPDTHPIEWQQFKDYAAQDVAAMRSLFKRTRQLPLAEWREYWASEAINDRGIGIDVDLAMAAASMADADKKLSARELAELTSNAVTSVNQVARINEWLMALLPNDGREILITVTKETDEDGVVTREQETSLERKRIERLLAYLETLKPLSERLHAAERVLQIRLYGGSKTPAKFGKMVDSQVDGIIRGQYVFGGASQTGRYSARGIQVHNLMRDAAPYEIDAIDALLAGVDIATFARLGEDTPVSRKLSLLIRPTLVAQPGHAFVWGDWANIEARIAPWLARDREADELLGVFRDVDDGVEKYDIYTRVAAEISGLPLDQVDKKIRQRGKVVSLACQFGGSTNALLNMAAGYRMHLTEDEARMAVQRWRRANEWAPRFWAELWQAAENAVRHPKRTFTAGRVLYVYLPDYLGGSLLCELPSGRFLTYRRAKWEYVDVLDEDSGEVIDRKREFRFSRDMGRLTLWPGLLCENIVQATAADILRGTLVRLEEDVADYMPVRLHTHDEVLVECAEEDVWWATDALRTTMVEGFDWSEGLPIAADTVVGRWYSKSENSWGL